MTKSHKMSVHYIPRYTARKQCGVDEETKRQTQAKVSALSITLYEPWANYLILLNFVSSSKKVEVLIIILIWLL
jgi:hypothetical protein